MSALYAVTVTPKDALTIGINLHHPTRIETDSLDLGDNYERIKMIADRQWAEAGREAQERRRRSGAWLEELMNKDSIKPH